MDSVVLESISNGNTPAGLRARELCAQAAKAQLMREGEGSEVAGGAMAGAGGLSVEAVAAHAMGLGAGSGNISLFVELSCLLFLLKEVKFCSFAEASQPVTAGYLFFPFQSGVIILAELLEYIYFLEYRLHKEKMTQQSLENKDSI